MLRFGLGACVWGLCILSGASAILWGASHLTNSQKDTPSPLHSTADTVKKQWGSMYTRTAQILEKDASTYITKTLKNVQKRSTQKKVCKKKGCVKSQTRSALPIFKSIAEHRAFLKRKGVVLSRKGYTVYSKKGRTIQAFQMKDQAFVGRKRVRGAGSSKSMKALRSGQLTSNAVIVDSKGRVYVLNSKP